MTFKQKVSDQYVQLVINKINALNATLQELRESSNNETKSSAGDKFETARAMIAVEQERISRQLNEALEQEIILKAIDVSILSTKIIQGSLVKTNKGYMFVSLALGKIKVDDIQVIALSPQSPLGIKLIGKKKGEVVEINDVTYMVENIG